MKFAAMLAMDVKPLPDTRERGEKNWERSTDAAHKTKHTNTVIGSALKDADKIQRMPRTDPNPGIPFVDVQPPWDSSDGLLTLWVVCTLLVGVFLAYIVWGPK